MCYENQIAALCGNIRFLRQKHGFSKTKMVKILGISIQYLNRLEHGELPRRLSYVSLCNISDYFGLPVQDLLRSLEK